MTKLTKGNTERLNPEEYVSPTTYPLEVYRWAIYILGGIVLTVLIAAIFFSFFEKEMDSAIVAIGSAALGGIVGIFGSGKNT